MVNEYPAGTHISVYLNGARKHLEEAAAAIGRDLSLRSVEELHRSQALVLGALLGAFPAPMGPMRLSWDPKLVNPCIVVGSTD